MLRACLKPASSRGPDDEGATVTQGVEVYNVCTMRWIELYLGVPNGKVESLLTPFEHLVIPFSGEIKVAP